MWLGLKFSFAVGFEKIIEFLKLFQTDQHPHSDEVLVDIGYGKIALVEKRMD